MIDCGLFMCFDNMIDSLNRKVDFGRCSIASVGRTKVLLFFVTIIGITNDCPLKIALFCPLLPLFYIIYIVGINSIYSDMFLQPSGSANHEAYVV